MGPEDVEKSLWFQRVQMHVVAPKDASTCRSKGPKGEWIERTCDFVIASGSLQGKISQMEVVEDFESRPHKVVSFVVKREKEIQGWNEQKLPKVEKKRRKMKTAKRKIVRYEIAQNVVAGIKEKAGVHEDA